MKKVPYMLVVGEKEKASGEVAVRQHTKGTIGNVTAEAFLEKIRQEIRQKLITI